MKKVTIALLLMTTAYMHGMNQDRDNDRQQETAFPSPLQIHREASAGFSPDTVDTQLSPHKIEAPQETLHLEQKKNSNCTRLAASYLIMGTAVMTVIISADAVLTYFNK